MNARTTISPSGDVAIPEDVRRQLKWEAGTELDIAVDKGGIRLRPTGPGSRFGSGNKTLEDLRALPVLGPPQSVEAISRLSDKDIRRLLDEGD